MLDPMPPPLDDDLAALDQVTEELMSVMEKVDDPQLERPTPCDDWSLEDLIDHVTGGNWFTIEVLGGQPADDALAAAHQRFVTDDRSCPQRALHSAAAQREAFARPEALDHSWHHISGELTGRQILRLRLHDLIVHAWDIDQALNPPGAVPVGLVHWGLSELANPDSLAVEATDRLADVEATDRQARYLAAFGRSV